MTKPYNRTKWLDETSTARRASLPRRVVAYGATGLDDSDLLHLVLGEKPRARLADLLQGDAAGLVACGLLSETQAGRLIGAFELCRRLVALRAELNRTRPAPG